MDCSPPGFSVYEIFQARILEWVAISCSRGSSPPRDRTGVSCTAGRFFTDSATREALTPYYYADNLGAVQACGYWGRCLSTTEAGREETSRYWNVMIPADRMQMGEDEHYTQYSLENQVPRKKWPQRKLMEVRSCAAHLGRKRVEEFRLQNRERNYFIWSLIFLSWWMTQGFEGLRSPGWMNAGPAVGRQASAVLNTPPGAAKDHLLPQPVGAQPCSVASRWPESTCSENTVRRRLGGWGFPATSSRLEVGFFTIIFNWRIIVLRCCVGFRHRSTWISPRYTRVLSLLSLPPTSHPIPPL